MNTLIIIYFVSLFEYYELSLGDYEARTAEKVKKNQVISDCNTGTTLASTIYNMTQT